MGLRVLSIQVAELVSNVSSRIYWMSTYTQVDLTDDDQAMELAEWIIDRQNDLRHKHLNRPEKRAIGVKICGLSKSQPSGSRARTPTLRKQGKSPSGGRSRSIMRRK